MQYEEEVQIPYGVKSSDPNLITHKGQNALNTIKKRVMESDSLLTIILFIRSYCDQMNECLLD